TASYSKWESEENQTDTFKLGVKHILSDGTIVGQVATWKNKLCWSSQGLTGPQDSLVYGPHYFQAKIYIRVYPQIVNPIEFTARFRMALDYEPQEANPNDPVCKIKVMYRYFYWDKNNSANNHYVDTIFLEKTLVISDFPQNGNFKDFGFDNQTYTYDVELFPPKETGRYSTDLLQPDTNIVFSDWFPATGIQYCVDWLGNSSTGTLYVDYAEVYDNDGWNEYIENPSEVENKITNYLSNYPTSEWPNIKYWYAHDEPRSIDDFIPIRTVDSLVRSVGGAPLITHFWEVNVNKNGDPIYQHFYNAVQPEKLMLNAYPFHLDTSEIGGLGSLVIKFQQSHELQPGFFYVPQAFRRVNLQGQVWGWYLPDSSELKSITMLALAFGSKGIMFSDYYTYWYNSNGGGYLQAIVDSLGIPSELWHVIHNNLAPRLKSKLGKTLLSL